MSCTSCSQPGPYGYSIQFLQNKQCPGSTPDCDPVKTECVFLSGAKLPVINADTGSNLGDILIKIDSLLAVTSGNYTSYNTACLSPAGDQITTEKQFVERISAKLCLLQTEVDTFIDTTFEDYKDVVDTRFTAIEEPGITSQFGIVSSDTLKQVLNKQNTAIKGLIDDISISSVTWDSCFSVPVKPTSIAAGFGLLASQICSVKSLVDSSLQSLPTVNNTNSCLPTPGPADSIIDTLNKIKVKLCQSPIWDFNAVTWGCVDKPTGSNANFQNAFQNVLNKVGALSDKSVEFDETDFQVEYIDSLVPCLGKKVKAVGQNTDKLVAASSTDNIPGYLDSKIAGGTPVKGISIGTQYNAAANKVLVTPDVDMEALVGFILDQIALSAPLKTKFCALVASCTPVVPPVVCNDPGVATVTVTSDKIAFYGVKSSASPLTEANILLSPSRTIFTDIITIDTTSTTQAQYVWMAELASEPLKTKWYGDVINNGPIEPGELFDVPVIVGAYRFYITAYPTIFTTQIQFKVS